MVTGARRERVLLYLQRIEELETTCLKKGVERPFRAPSSGGKKEKTRREGKVRGEWVSSKHQLSFLPAPHLLRYRLRAGSVMDLQFLAPGPAQLQPLEKVGGRRGRIGKELIGGESAIII